MKIKPYSTDDGERGYVFYCPACSEKHFYRLEAGKLPKSDGGRWPVWYFNDDEESPTFSPSLLLFSSPGQWVHGEWVATGPRKTYCHLFVTDGSIVYCGDCPHAYAGQTIPLPDLPVQH